MVYVLDGDGDYLDDNAYADGVPTAKDAGTYKVWYKVIGDENHNSTEFPTEPGTYIAAVTANEDSETYIGENRSEPFTIAAPDDSSSPDDSSKKDDSSKAEENKTDSSSKAATTASTSNPSTGTAVAGMSALALAAAAVMATKKKK